MRALHAALAPHAASGGTYVNALDDEGTEAPVRTAYGADKYERLARTKAVYDPGNVFHRNVNVRPAVPTPAQRGPAPVETPAAVALDAGA